MIRMANQLHYFSSRKMVRRAFYRPWTNQGKGICRMFNAISSSSTLASWQPNFPTFFASNSMCVLLMQLMLSCSLSLSLSLLFSHFLCLASSVTRLGDFGKLLATKFLAKEAEMIGTFWAILKNLTLMKKLHLLHFGQLLEKIGLLFTLTSGHTASEQILSSCIPHTHPSAQGAIYIMYNLCTLSTLSPCKLE